MPEVSGFAVTAAIRRLEDESGGKRAYIAALTGLVSDKDRQAAYAAGTDEYITKPAGLENVKAAIGRWRSLRKSALLDDNDSETAVEG